MNKEGELLSEIIKVSSEKEVLKREVSEMCERVQLLEKASRQLELDNERLAYKLAIRMPPTEEGGEEDTALPSSKDPIIVENKRDGIKEKEPKDKELSPKESPKLSALVAESPRLSMLRKLEIVGDAKSDLNIGGCVPSPRRYAALLERTDIGRLEEMHKLLSEQEKLRGQVGLLSEKYNSLAMRHLQYKSKRKSQVEDLRARLDVELSSLQSEVDALQARLAMQKKTLRSEEAFRRRVEADYRRLQDDKRKLVVNMMASENTSRDREQEVTLLNKKIGMLERANSELLSRVLDLKYAARHSSNSPHKTPSPSEDIKMLEISSAV
ncbi:Hypothetical predicted protein [Cloeon dipterum]|uniref:Uncharacterized protein n=1 Tax=Cloeon dipterum TaxID=197152 RepID=A0A8S1E4M0_9INSE|nr:Hypothetical predicted protein [Cloeon dipterum]